MTRRKTEQNKGAQCSTLGGCGKITNHPVISRTFYLYLVGNLWSVPFLIYKVSSIYATNMWYVQYFLCGWEKPKIFFCMFCVRLILLISFFQVQNSVFRVAINYITVPQVTGRVGIRNQVITQIDKVK